MENDRRRFNTAPDFMARGYSVFNAAQVEEYEPPPIVIQPPSVRIGRAEDFFSSLGADIRHGENRA